MKFRRITEADRGRNRTMSNRPVRTASDRKKIRRERYDKSIGKWIPRYAIFSVIFCFVFNSLIYSGTQFLMRNAKHRQKERIQGHCHNIVRNRYYFDCEE